MPENRQASNDGSEILKLQILDIRGTSEHSSTTRELKQEIIRGLSSKTINFQDYRAVKENRKPPIITLRSLPTMLLYDSKGLDIFDRITYDKDYYLTNAEIEILSENSKYFVQKYLSDGDYIIELGAGSMRKTDYILRAISDLNISITYYAVDLSESSLKKSLEPYVARYPRIKFVGMWGTYHDSLKWIKDFQGNKVVKKVYLWLGSSIGNYQRDQAAKLMVQFCEQGIDTGDLFLCGIDRRNSYEAVSLAYNDRSGLTREFALNGLSNANSIFGKQVFNLENFEYVSIYNELEGRHEAYFEVNEDHTIEFDNESEIIKLQKGELIQFEYSYKYSAAEVETLVRSAGLGQLGKYTDSKNMYDLHIFFKFPFLFREEHDQIGILNMLRWDDLFQASKTLFCDLVTFNSMLEKPIQLRHPFIFYFGHLPAFNDAQLSNAFNEPLTEPAEFASMFQRGIDPNVDDPSICHKHSEVPDTWPEITDIWIYRHLVEKRVKKILSNPKTLDRRVLRVLNMCFEHEAMHLETLTYMLVQSALPIRNRFPTPIFQKQHPCSRASWISVLRGTVKLGIDDCEERDSILDGCDPFEFGWDNESPSLMKEVPNFVIQNRPVAVFEYLKFLDIFDWQEDLVPLSWINQRDNWFVKSMHGPVCISFALNWPVYCSHFQATKYAEYYSSELPNEEQLLYLKTVDSAQISGFRARTLHPENVENAPAGKVSDLYCNGWEWTSTIFRGFPGFRKSTIYPGYSADFL